MAKDTPGIRQGPTLRLSRAQEMRLWHADTLADDSVLLRIAATGELAVGDMDFFDR